MLKIVVSTTSVKVRFVVLRSKVGIFIIFLPACRVTSSGEKSVKQKINLVWPKLTRECMLCLISIAGLSNGLDGVGRLTDVHMPPSEHVQIVTKCRPA